MSQFEDRDADNYPVVEYSENMEETARLLTLLCYGFNKKLNLGELYEFTLLIIAREGGVSEETIAMILERCHLPQSPTSGVLQ